MELKRALTKAQEDNSRTQLERDKEYMNMKTLVIKLCCTNCGVTNQLFVM